MKVFQKFLGAALVSAVLASTAGAAAQTPTGYENLIGSWDCRINQGTGTMQVLTTYHPDGRFISLGSTTDNSSGQELTFQITAEGRWNVSNNQLTETGSSFTLLWGRMGGQPLIPGSQMWATMEGAMRSVIGQPNVRTIEALSATSISLDYQGYDITCPRP